ncbi:hypothetical protein [Actinacidiphila sp. bgisy144]
MRAGGGTYAGARGNCAAGRLYGSSYFLPAGYEDAIAALGDFEKALGSL